MSTHTHGYALVEISAPAFNEIAQKLLKAGHQQAFVGNAGKAELDMHGIGLTPDPNIRPGTTNIETLSLLSARTKQGLVQLRVGEVSVQMDLDKAREVVGLLQGAIEAAISDQLVFEFLTKKLGLDPDRAGHALVDFRELRQASRSTVIPS
jgi:hypothetical protein